MPLDAVGATVAAKRQGTTVTLLTLPLAPAAHARRAHAEPFPGLAMRKTIRHRRKNPNTKID